MFAIVVVLSIVASVATVIVRMRGSEPTAQGGSASGAPSAAAASSSPSGAPSCTPGQSGPLREDTTFTPSGSGTPIHFSISLPEDYYTACRQYPVLYALHGRDQDNVSFMNEALDLRRAMAAGALDAAIIVTPDSFKSGRWENRDTGPAEDNLIKHLIPHVESTYRVLPGPEQRLLVGFSMGGHGALRFGLKYPDLFAGVWSIDGAMSTNNEDYTQYLKGRSPSDFHIIAVGGRLNGQRVRVALDALKAGGLDIPNTYQDREHEFRAFVQEDEKGGWYAVRFLQNRLGKPLVSSGA